MDKLYNVLGGDGYGGEGKKNRIGYILKQGAQARCHWKGDI